MKKFLSVLLALAMIFSLTVTVSADETKGEMDGYVVVLHTNDVHGAISGYAKVAALKKAYEACRKGIEEKTLAPWSGAAAGWIDDFYKKNGYEVYYEFMAYPNRKMVRLIKKI